jgi:hypothetical protein
VRTKRAAVICLLLPPRIPTCAACSTNPGKTPLLQILELLNLLNVRKKAIEFDSSPGHQIFFIYQITITL